MDFRITTIEDASQILGWMLADPDHRNKDISADWWFTGMSDLLSFCLLDDRGPLCYIRLDKEGTLARLATQFAPEEEVSKRRLIVGLLWAFRTFFPQLKNMGMTGVIFESTSPTLIAFMKKQNFKEIGNNDYVFSFEEIT